MGSTVRFLSVLQTGRLAVFGQVGLEGEALAASLALVLFVV